MEISIAQKVNNLPKDDFVDNSWAINFFDLNLNGEFEKNEINIFEASKFENHDNIKRIITPDGNIYDFQDMSINKGDEFYKTGTIPVAVIDDIKNWHGKVIMNILKNKNLDLSVYGFDSNSKNSLNSFQKIFQNIIQYIQQNPELRNIAYYSSENIRNILINLENKIIPDDFRDKDIGYALDEVKKEIDNGKNFEAINLSLGQAISYNDINKICKDKIGEEITPENCAKYKTQIKEIFKQKVKENKNLKLFDARYSEETINLSVILENIEKIEKLKIPTYLAQTYKDKNNSQTFNLYSLADNTLTVESGRINKDNSLSVPKSSTNSCALDENGKRRIVVPDIFDGYFIDMYSTSFATPIVLANELKHHKGGIPF